MKKHLDSGSGTSFRPCHQVKAVTYVERCTYVHRSTYVCTAFGVRAYGVRRTSPSGRKAMMKQGQREERKDEKEA